MSNKKAAKKPSNVVPIVKPEAAPVGRKRKALPGLPAGQPVSAQIVQQILAGKQKAKSRHTQLLAERAVQAQADHAEIGRNIQVLNQRLQQLQRAQIEVEGRLRGYHADLVSMVEMDEGIAHAPEAQTPPADETKAPQSAASA